jgi:hypothetical protein
MRQIIKAVLSVVFFFLSLSLACAQSQPLKSFAYASQGCTTTGGAPVLQFTSGGAWQMGLGSGMAPAGAGVFPAGNFYVRAIGITVNAGSNTNWVLVGHSGPNGDWMNSPVLPGKTVWLRYPSDAAPLFTAGEYFDAHVASCDGIIAAFISFWTVPAP